MAASLFLAEASPVAPAAPSQARAPALANPAPPVAAAPVQPVFTVVPGGGGSPLAASPRGGPPRVIWTGFQMTDGGSRVFVQTSAEVELDVASHKDGLTVTLHNCRVHMRNNSRTLDTRFFASPVQQVVVHQHRRDVELAIALKAPAQSVPHKETNADGSHFWVIDFTPPEQAPVPPEKSVSLK